MSKNRPFGIVDIFAGPGGLSEGFARAGSFEDRPFEVALSIEKDPAAHRTLRFRSLVHELAQSEYRQYIEILNSNVIDLEEAVRKTFPDAWSSAEHIAKLHELSEANRPATEAMLESVERRFGGNTGLIGGPPCQVYSLVGRSRNAKNHMYAGDDDPRHTLYKEYIHVLGHLKPAFFVMENVKGMLSSKHQSELIFPMVRDDLESAGDGYTLFALAPRQQSAGLISPGFMPIDHRNFLVRMEEFGVPQKRHRIVILGIRNEIAARISTSDQNSFSLRTSNTTTSVGELISDLPKLRSGLSKGDDSDERWATIIGDATSTLLALPLEHAIRSIIEEIEGDHFLGRLSTARYSQAFENVTADSKARKWVRSEGLSRLHHHETRSHIPGDLTRYIFAAAYAKVHSRSPRASEFPPELAPNHHNWNSGNFNDRFRVQVDKFPSSTIMSHISKDGHYYIHPDPKQARSLTVREAARLQTFPDDYIFLGNRTERYHQVGNAVPPYLAAQIAHIIAVMI